MWRNSGKKTLSLVLTASILFGTVGLTGCGTSEKEKEPVTLEVYSMLANYSGVQTGWIADILKEKFGIKLDIIPQGNNEFETRQAAGNLGDIIVFGGNSDQYAAAVRDGLLYDWDQGNLLSKEGSYIKEHMQDALEKNRTLTSTITDGQSDVLYGFGHDVATSKEDHSSFFYTWDLRWDVYKELGYPVVKDLEDYEKLMVDMCKQCPTNDEGQPTYAVSIWPDWDDAMVMYVKSTATAYYGYDELGIGLYDPDTGDFHGALEENGPYLEMLKFYNKLYQDGILDPESVSQDYKMSTAKVKSGTTMFSIFDYAGRAGYNQSKHTEKGKIMLSMRPEDASPLAYGMNTAGGERIWTIGSQTKYPELCMKLLNWLCTPEGRLTVEYGPKDLCWKYDKQKNTSLTELGLQCRKSSDTKIGNGYKGNFGDGILKIANTTWALDSENPESNGETYNYLTWKKTSESSASEIEKDWQEHAGYANAEEYLNAGKHKISGEYTMAEKPDNVKAVWKKVTTKLRDYSWKAIYATSDKEYDVIVDEMLRECKEEGYETCASWCNEEAKNRYADSK